MIVLLFAIVDFARVYTAMMSVESAAREAADYGTEYGAGHWNSAVVADTVVKMEERACIAASNLNDYASDPSFDPDTPSPTTPPCVNPTFQCTVTAPKDPSTGSDSTYTPCQTLPDAAGCDDPGRDPDGDGIQDPCLVTVTLTYQFNLLNPFTLQHLGIPFGLITFTRDSTFAVTDISVAGTPGP